MKIEVIGKKCTPRDSFKERAEKKLEKVERLFGGDTVAKITAAVEKSGKSVEITLQKHGVIFRAQERAQELDTALDKAVDALIRQIRKNKTRVEKKLRATHLVEEVFTGLPIAELEETQFDIVRTKSLPLKPESVEEAILQMNLLGHSFYLFLNAESGQLNLVYTRADGGYGLLVPRFA
ncbi:MAG: ribosome-associated translation inhibitor RaiA [Oscillospiraceae bacterium]|jgi:putative sigma-54 modulation protein|nr:ribosome-associated translation inhibitor RaiA [Oscillospiraceae bacterium]